MERNSKTMHEQPVQFNHLPEETAAFLENYFNGKLKIGTRNPVKEAPVWVTLEVGKWGNATGRFLAGGPFTNYERELCKSISSCAKESDTSRKALNMWHLSQRGMDLLRSMVTTGLYQIDYPEQGALLACVYLVDRYMIDEANSILTDILPFFDQLSFYPTPTDHPTDYHDDQVFLHSAQTAIEKLQSKQIPTRIKAHRDALLIWIPFEDRLLEFFNNPTMTADLKKAEQLLADYNQLKQKYSGCFKRRMKRFFSIMIDALKFLVAKESMDRLPPRLAGRLRLLLQHKNSRDPVKLAKTREMQKQELKTPTIDHFTPILIHRLDNHCKFLGIPDVDFVCQPLSEDEVKSSDLQTIQANQKIPKALCHLIRSSMSGTVQELIENNIVTSAEVLADLMAFPAGAILSAALPDDIAQRFYYNSYLAFYNRRSLLLLNYQSQVRIEELPWIRPLWNLIDKTNMDQLFHSCLSKIATVYLDNFPETIIPNNLVTLLNNIQMKMSVKQDPLLKQIAADIFMGGFTAPFSNAARAASEILNSTLYAKYYQLPDDFNCQLKSHDDNDPVVAACYRRANVESSSSLWGQVIENGMVLEQMQILTTHNLTEMNARWELCVDWQHAAEKCFNSVVKMTQNIKEAPHHSARLHLVSNAAIAWRQMIFFLSIGKLDSDRFIKWGHEQIAAETEAVRRAVGTLLSDLESCKQMFCGWSKGTHWYLQLVLQ